MSMLKPDQTVLVIVDVQGKLAGLMGHGTRYVSNIRILIKAAHLLHIPIVYTEQMPDKIGSTIPAIKELLEDIEPIHKSAFSCAGEPVFMKRLAGKGRLQILLTGIESHVCVHQTAYDLIQHQYDVHVACDAVSARSLESHETAIRRIQQDGARISTTEMAMCEWTGGADHPEFRSILSLMKSVAKKEDL